MSAEEWRAVVGYESAYEVSDLGRVRSIRSGGKRRVLTRFARANGYLAVNFYTSRLGHQQKLVHRLVAQAFIGAPPNGTQVCHGDGDRANNALANLRWDTVSANALDRQAHGTDAGRRKTHCPRGHRLVEPNLRKSHLEKGWRTCQSCGLARRGAAGDAGTWQALSDAIYARLGVSDAVA